VSLRSTATPELVGVEPDSELFSPRSGRGAVQVRLRSYAIGRFPVTNDEYGQFAHASGRTVLPQGWAGGKPQEDRGRQPVMGLTATEAEAYCRWLSNVTGHSFRLPQEAEWEYAAGGPGRLVYPWGDRFEPSRCNSLDGGSRGPVPVDAHPAGMSPVGCLDMAGNVAEYCADIFRAYDSPDPSGERDIDGTLSRSLRGGSYLSSREDVRCATRRPCLAEDHALVGFRVCRSG
jgi:toxoflavin biosynthesis protein ToxD